MRLLELFSGTHSVGKVAAQKGYEVVSLDRDLSAACPFTNYVSAQHLQCDIMNWNYREFPQDHFDVITASPVCVWWSKLRDCWINRKAPSIRKGVVITREILNEDIDNMGKPMVDKVFEIINYFKPKYWWIENPDTGRMKDYITDKPYYIVDYCKYGFPYKKRTRIWTNIEDFEAKKCNNDCEHMVKISEKRKIHINNLGNEKCRKAAKKHAKLISDIGGGNNRLERYRIPPKLIEDLLEKIKIE